MFHSLTVPVSSVQAVASVRLSGLNAKEDAGKQASRGLPSEVTSSGWVTFHRLTTPADRTAARVRPSGLNASDRTELMASQSPTPVFAGRPSRTGWLGLVRFHRSTKPPEPPSPRLFVWPPTARVWPSGLNASDRIESTPPSSGSGAPSAAGWLGSETSHSRTVFWWTYPAARVWPSGL